MARGTQLGTLVTQLKSEMGLSNSAAHSVNRLDTFKYELKAVQESLWLEYDWSFMRGTEDVAMATGSRYYDLPVDPGRIDRVDCKWTDIWRPLERGIGTEQYNQYNGDETRQFEPALRWDLYTDAGGEQFEVWPVPSTNNQIVRFQGVRNLSALVSETDTADLDDRLIVLFAAASLSTDPEKRREKVLKANSHMKRLTKRYGANVKSFNLNGGGGRTSGRPAPGPVRVAYPPSTS